MQAQRFQEHMRWAMVAIAWVACMCGPACAQSWPRINLPSALRTFSLGAPLDMNGQAMQLQGFTTPLSTGDCLAQLRQSLGEPIVENTLGHWQVLGQQRGDFYLTVQIRPAGEGARGVVAVARLRAGDRSTASAPAHNTPSDTPAQWQDRLPAGTQVISVMRSYDSPRASTHIVYRNRYDGQLNRDHLEHVLAGEGLVMQTQPPHLRPASGGAIAAEPARVLHFSGQGKEALATIAPYPLGGSAVVLNILSTPKSTP